MKPPPPSILVTEAASACLAVSRPTAAAVFLFSLLSFSAPLLCLALRRGEARPVASDQASERGRTDRPPSSQLSLLVLVSEIGPAA